MLDAVCINLFAQAADLNRERIVIHKTAAVIPEVIKDLFSGQHLTAVEPQIFQQF